MEVNQETNKSIIRESIKGLSSNNSSTDYWETLPLEQDFEEANGIKEATSGEKKGSEDVLNAHWF